MKKMLIAEIGNCVHAAGAFNFNNLAKKEGYKTVYMGSAISLEKLFGAIIEFQPDTVSIGYRLNDKSLIALLNEIEHFVTRDLIKRQYLFGGTLETGKIARKYKFISKIFDGRETEEEVIFFLKNGFNKKTQNINYPQSLKERIKFKGTTPLFRHHIGLDSVKKTSENIKVLAESGLLDIISLAPDQNCQEMFYDQKKMDKKNDGAGGVPIRSSRDLELLYESSRCGNYPLMRCYSGTNNILEFTKMLKKSINNAWAAIPLTWYSDLDRRSERELLTAIEENMGAIKWNGMNKIPVEINESHQWALRYCNDAIEVATAYLVAIIAKKLGVEEYVSQLMLATPPSITPTMDIAKMLAKNELINELHDNRFTSYKMIRTGLLAYPADLDEAKGLLASTMFYGAYLEPQIIHVVSYCEARYCATAKEILESVKIVKKAVKLGNKGLPDFKNDIEIKLRKEKLIEEALLIIDAIQKIGTGKENPLLDPKVIYEAINIGLLDAPGLKGFSIAKGLFKTEIVDGYHVSVDSKGRVLREKDRLKLLGF